MENKNALVVVPEEENIIISFAVTDDKPFNKCFECRSFRNGCSGPNLAVMGVARACEFLQMARIFLGLSYQQVSDGTDVSLATVKRTLTGKVSDPSFFTIMAISTYLLGDPNGKYPCAIPDINTSDASLAQLQEATKELERALADNQDYRAALDAIHTSYNMEMQTIRDEGQKKVDYLLGQVDRLRMEIDYLRLENDRKAKIIDKYLDS